MKTQNYQIANPLTMGVCNPKNTDKKPILFMLVGLPGSGKSTYAKMLQITSRNRGPNPVIVSTDEIRGELLGNDEDQSGNEMVFETAYDRICHNLLEGLDVIFDATNINKKRRIFFLKKIGKIPCSRVCHVVMTPFEECLRRNAARERQVPEEVLKRMYMNWNPPHKHEGFDEVTFYYSELGDSNIEEKYTLLNLYNDKARFLGLDQENAHHAHTVGEHCILAMISTYFQWNSRVRLQIAALLHDIGKAFTKTRLNTRGESDGNCHYYQHHCVGAYDSLLYMQWLALSEDDMSYISNLIYYHMHPHMSWKQSERAKERDRKLIGEEMYEDILRLHEADNASR